MFKDELNSALKTKEQLERERIDNLHKRDIDACDSMISHIKRIALEKVSKGEFKYSNGRKQVYASYTYEYALNKSVQKPLFNCIGRETTTYSVNQFLVNELHSKASKEGIKILDYGLTYNHEMLGNVKKSGVLEITQKYPTFFCIRPPRFYIDCVILF